MRKKEHLFIKNFLAILVIIAICSIISIGIVWPLWKFSVSFKGIYTVLVISLLICWGFFLIIKNIKKISFKKSIPYFFNSLFVILSLFFSIFLVITQKRLLALIVILLGTAIIIIFNLIWNKKNYEK